MDSMAGTSAEADPAPAPALAPAPSPARWQHIYYNIYLIFISNFSPWHEAYEIAARPWPWIDKVEERNAA